MEQPSPAEYQTTPTIAIPKDARPIKKFQSRLFALRKIKCESPSSQNVYHISSSCAVKQVQPSHPSVHFNAIISISYTYFRKTMPAVPSLQTHSSRLIGQNVLAKSQSSCEQNCGNRVAYRTSNNLITLSNLRNTPLTTPSKTSRRSMERHRLHRTSTTQTSRYCRPIAFDISLHFRSCIQVRRVRCRLSLGNLLLQRRRMDWRSRRLGF